MFGDIARDLAIPFDPDPGEDDDLAERAFDGPCRSACRFVAAAKFKDSSHNRSPRWLALCLAGATSPGHHKDAGKVNELLTASPLSTSFRVRCIPKKVPPGPVLDFDDPEVRVELSLARQIAIRLGLS